MSEDTSTSVVHSLISIEGNNRCIDCDLDHVQWVSLNNSVFLCNDCAEKHTALEHVSILRPLDFQFSNEELKLLEIGGNSRFIANLKEFGIEVSCNAENDSEMSLNKYLYVASVYYRKLIISELTNQKQPDKPQIKLAQELYLVDLEQSEDETSKKKGKSIVSKFGEFFSKAATKAKSSIKITEDKFSKLELTLKAKKTGKFLSDKASSLTVTLT